MGKDDCLAAGDDRNAIETAERIDDHRRGQIVLHRHRIAVDGKGIALCPCALRDRHMTIVCLLKSVGFHLPGGQKGVCGVRSTIAERGGHEELIARDGLYREIYDLELRDQEEALKRFSDSPSGSDL